MKYGFHYNTVFGTQIDMLIGKTQQKKFVSNPTKVGYRCFFSMSLKFTPYRLKAKIQQLVDSIYINL